MKKPRKKAPRKGTTKKKISRAVNKAAKARNKRKVGRGKPKGKSPAALTKPKTRRLRAVAPPPREVGLLDAVGEVFADIEELAQEMRTWAENMEDRFGSTQKYSDVDQAAETLEDIQDPTDSATMAFLNEITITVQDPTPRRAPRSRATRLGDAGDVLSQVITKLEDPTLLVVADAPLTAGQKATCEELHSSLDEIEGELQGVEFPGMF